MCLFGVKGERAGRRVRVCRVFVRIGRYKVLILIGVNKIGEDLYKQREFLQRLYCE